MSEELKNKTVGRRKEESWKRGRKGQLEREIGEGQRKRQRSE